MSVSSKHPDFVRMEKIWRKCRDVYAGTDAMRAATTDYLPMLTDEAHDAYMARLNRTVLYNAFYRTVSGFTGMLFRRPAVLDAPEHTVSLTDDITMTGVPLNVLAQDIADECQIVSRVGIYTNYPIADTSTMTQADAIALNLRPSMSIIKTEQIINWRHRRVNNKHVLSLAVVQEEFLEPVNEFKDKSVIRYRVLDLDENDTYRVRIMSEDDKGNDILIEGPFYPMMNGATMNFIPLVIIGPDSISADVEEPILVDLADLCVAHFGAYSSLANGCHFSGIPTPIFIGLEVPTDGKINVGMGRGIIIPNPAGDAKMLEVGTAGFSALSDQLNRLESSMISIGSKLLETTRLQAESSATAMIYRNGENGILSALSISISAGITIALKTFSAWAGDDAAKVKFTLNQEFFREQVSPEMIKALVEGWQQRMMSAEANFNYLKAREFYEPSMTFEEEQSRILAGAPKEPAKPSIVTKIEKSDDGKSMTATRMP